MTDEFERLVEQSSRNIATVLDTYGAKDPGEFFAVCTECFFERSLAFERRHRKLYELLKDYYKQDPAARFAAAGPPAADRMRAGAAGPAGPAGKPGRPGAHGPAGTPGRPGGKYPGRGGRP
jgi:hypothetical protein